MSLCMRHWSVLLCVRICDVNVWVRGGVLAVLRVLQLLLAGSTTRGCILYGF